MGQESVRVLIVDEDAAFLREAVMELSGHFSVCACPSGDHALRVYEAFRPQVVLLDGDIKDIPFTLLLEKLQERNGALQWIATSGSADSLKDVRQALSGRRIDRILRKPFSFPDLIGWIRDSRGNRVEAGADPDGWSGLPVDPPSPPAVLHEVRKARQKLCVVEIAAGHDRKAPAGPGTEAEGSEERQEENVLSDLVQGTREALAAHEAQREQQIHRVGEIRRSAGNRDTLPEAHKGIGMDIGTSRIVCLHPDETDPDAGSQLNAFLSVAESRFLKEVLIKNRIPHSRVEEETVILGRPARQFAEIFNGEIRRPMRHGLLSPQEPHAVPVLQEILRLLLPEAAGPGQPLCFCVPAPVAGLESDFVYHEGILKKHLAGLGYRVKSIFKGMAVVLAELAEDNYTGIGISMGAGMCNVCLSFLSMPVISFGLRRGGDDIDDAAARVTREALHRVRAVKEESLDFSRPARTRLESALQIFYEDLVRDLLHALASRLSQAERLPRMNQAVPVVLAGGTCLPNGFAGWFEQLLKEARVPLGISAVRLAQDPLRSAATGALLSTAV